MELRVQLTRRPDGNVILRCTRQDESVTWQRYDRQSAHFCHHDLTHFAVESVLGLRRGFFGLLADGWDITDTTGKGSRGPLSFDSAFVEHIVGLFDGERGGVISPASAAEFNALIAQMTGRPLEPPLTDLQLTGVRNRIAELHMQWAATPPGSTLDLTFDRSEPAFVPRSWHAEHKES